MGGASGILRDGMRRLNGLPPRAQAWIAALLPTAWLLPAINKAYHIDDPLFVWTARKIVETPGDFYGFDLIWYYDVEPMYLVMQNPPLISYYLAPFGALFGWGEAVMHLALLPFATALGLGSWLVARRFCAHPLAATLIATLTPGVLISASQVMSDVPMLALWIWAMHCWFNGIERDRAGWCVAAGALIALGTITKYFAGSLVPLLGLYTLLQGPAHRRKLYALLIPLVALFAYEFWTYRLYGLGLFADAGRFAAEQRVRDGVSVFSKGVTTLVFTGGCLITPALLALAVVPRWARYAGGAAIPVFFVVGAATLSGWLMPPVNLINLVNPDVAPFRVETLAPGWGHFLHWAVFLAAGAALPLLALDDLRRRRDALSLLLLLWVGGTLLFVAALNHIVNARVIIPLALPYALLVARRIEALSVDDASARRLWGHAGSAAAAGAAITAALFAADYRLADTARRAAADILALPRAEGARVWFSGHSGFQYYMEAGGAETVERTRSIARAGDLVALPVNNWGHVTLTPELVASHAVLSYWSVPFAVTSHHQRFAGFYADRTGALPFVFGAAPREQYLVCTVGTRPEVTQPGR